MSSMRRGGEIPSSTPALAGASHIARQRLRPVLTTKVPPPPLPANTHSTPDMPAHACAHRRARACLPDLPPSLTHPLACHPILSCLIRSPACQPSIPHSPLPYPPPRRNRAPPPLAPPPIVLLAQDGRREHHCRCSEARSLPFTPPSPYPHPCKDTYAMPCHAIPCHTILVPFHIIPTTYHTIPYHTMPYHAMPCHAMPCHAMPCHVMPCHAMPYHTIPYHAIPSPSPSLKWPVGWRVH